MRQFLGHNTAAHTAILNDGAQSGTPYAPPAQPAYCSVKNGPECRDTLGTTRTQYVRKLPSAGCSALAKNTMADI
ncbi:hypothetical protein ON010_g12271 [Phytophthora cinnamomi]|nr:hypothetical protein ON010_g12271 [Phytophthora cinnamomi]